jgi:5-methylcytosine-specific restriction endonuclease McrA
MSFAAETALPAPGGALLNSRVLVLNRSYLPVHVTSVKRAFALLYQGVARVVDEQYRTFDFESWRHLSIELHHERIGIVDGFIRVPRVLLLSAYERVPRRHVRFSRFNIFARDSNTCQYCGQRLPRTDLNLDHVIPRSRGGLSTWENIVCSCHVCNRRKGGRTPEQAGMRLLRPPRRPEKLPGVLTITIGLHSAPDAWRDFLYWNVRLDED